MNKQEAIEEIKNLEGLTILDKTINFDSEMIPKKEVFNIINKIDEQEKTVVPQFVADWYEECKDYFDFNIYGFYKYFYSQGKHEEIKKWLDNAENKAIETLVKMKLYGYEVEKEKLYTVELPDPNGGGHVILCKNGDGTVSIAFSSVARWRGSKNVQLTESEIKKDFEWAWQFAKEVEE
ncbi:DUF1642 domain-containing protein [Streptococcus sp.]|uniref:DUF1642 domain-containing protein n=1 Tax=Streptococcus sp. TaxID=1306 RepID=UPI003AF05DC4